jgi:hypothetical protein
MNGRARLPAVPFEAPFAAPFDKPRQRSARRERRVHSPTHRESIPQRVLRPAVPSNPLVGKNGRARLPAVPFGEPFDKPRRRSDKH